MKRSHIVPVSVAALALALITNSCQEISSYKYPRAVDFSASTEYINGVFTKTEYSGFIADGQNKERIDWVEGDQIRIFTSTGNQVADYNVSAPSPSSDHNSEASITPVNAHGVQWLNDDYHTFVATYPSGALSSAGVVSASIPATQTVTLKENTVATFLPDMDLGYMVATETARESDGSVVLDFIPAMTAFEFNVALGEGSQVTVNGFEMRSSSSALTGAFTWDPTTGFTCPDREEGVNDRISILFEDSGNGITLEAGQAISFTVFALPQSLTGITLIFRLSSGDCALELKKEGVFHVFDPCKKYRITTPGIDGDWEYHLIHTGTTITLPDDDATEAQVLVLPTGDAGDTGEGLFDSYKNHPGSTTKVAANISSTYEYALSDENGDPVLNSDGTIAWSSEAPEGITSLTIAGNVSQTIIASLESNDNPEVLEAIYETLTHAQNLQSKGTNGFTSNAPQDLSLYDVENLTTPRSSGKPTTANCYIVDRAGWYMFPVVYGNSIDYTKEGTGAPLYDNGVNRYSYTDGAAGEQTVDIVIPINNGTGFNRYWYWHTLQAYDGHFITSPYILDDTGIDYSAVDAVIVWEDVDSQTRAFIQNVSVESISTSNVYYDPVSGNYKTSMPFIKFEIPEGSINSDETLSVNERITGIRQGNAVIALRNKNDIDDYTSKPRILWSWHIWVTDGYDNTGDYKGDGLDPIQMKTSGIVSVKPYNYFMPVNVGSCDTGSYTTYKDRVWYVRIRQEHGQEDGLVFKVIQQTEPLKIGPSAPYYQIGRKDPFLPAEDGRFIKNKSFFSPSGYSGLELNSYSLTLDNEPATDASSAIQHPYIYYKVHPNIDMYAGWVAFPEGKSYNGNIPDLWCMGLQHNLDIVTAKTIYDPCPPRYCVPHRYAFTGFIKNWTGGSNFTNVYSRFNVIDRNGDGVISVNDYENGWLFDTGYDNGGIFFPETSRRWSQSGYGLQLGLQFSVGEYPTTIGTGSMNTFSSGSITIIAGGGVGDAFSVRAALE